MPKKPSVRTFMDSEYVKGSETLHKSSRQYFRHIFWSLWKNISSKSSVLVVSEILRLFFNNMLKGPKGCLNLHGSVFVIFFDHPESKSARNTLF